MLPDKKVWCHKTGFEKKCFDMVTKKGCELWGYKVGLDRNTGQHEQVWGCTEKFAFGLQIELIQQMRELGAAMEGMRNETARAADTTNEVAVRSQTLIETIVEARRLVEDAVQYPQINTGSRILLEDGR
jgi:hypothetical protein